MCSEFFFFNIYKNKLLLSLDISNYDMSSLDYLWTEDYLNSFEIENRFTDTTITFIIVSKDPSTCYDNLIRFSQPWLKSYPWTIDQPSITQQSTNIKGTKIDYIYGELNYHEYTPESLLLISILFQFTKYHQDCYIHLFDSITIEPILYYCHDFLPNDLQDINTSINRTWIHDFNIIVLNLHDDRYVNLFIAIQQLNNLDYTINHQLREFWHEKIVFDEYLKIVHDVEIVNLPLDIGKLITHDPTMIGKALVALEQVLKLEKISNGEPPSPSPPLECCDVIVPINDINLATLGSLCISNSDNDIRIRDILAHGLSKWYSDRSNSNSNSEPLPLIPSSIVKISRLDLQKELINRGLLSHIVEEDKDVYQVIANMDTNETTIENEEEFANQLSQILLDKRVQNLIEEEEEDEDKDEDDDDDYLELSDDELIDFRNKYYEITNVWLDKDQVKSKYNQFKQLIITLVNNFKQEFENTEFDDFPEFMETNVILDLNEGYNDDSDYKSDDEGTYQGDMAFEEYIKFKKKLRKEGGIVGSDNDEEDEDWEDIDNDDDDEDYGYSDDGDSDGYIEEIYQESPKISEIHDPDPEVIERLSNNLRNLQTNDRQKPSNLEDIIRNTYK